MRPFFIIGSPRSGTTLFRDILRANRQVTCPEETHFYRLAFPFGGGEYTQFFKKNKVLRNHRELDGISEDEFWSIYHESLTRHDLNSKYAMAVARKKKNVEYWFDKTPQNVYGLPLLLAQFPEAKFVHLVRHPLSVAKSLMAGRVMPAQSLIGSLNYWLEAVTIIGTLKPLLGNNLLEIKYEDLLEDAHSVVDQTVSFLNLQPFEPDLDHVSKDVSIPFSDFVDSELSKASKILGKYPGLYGYTIFPTAGDQ